MVTIIIVASTAALLVFAIGVTSSFLIHHRRLRRSQAVDIEKLVKSGEYVHVLTSAHYNNKDVVVIALPDTRTVHLVKLNSIRPMGTHLALSPGEYRLNVRVEKRPGDGKQLRVQDLELTESFKLMG